MSEQVTVNHETRCVDPEAAGSCDDPVTARGLCRRHYYRHYYRGTLHRFPRVKRWMNGELSAPSRDAPLTRKVARTKLARCYGRTRCTGVPRNNMRGLCGACYDRHRKRGTLLAFPTVNERLAASGW